MTSVFQFAQEMVVTEPVPIPRNVFIIAEIGINHNGDLSIAKQLIDMAKNAGCDAVKFQKRTIEIVYSKDVLDSPRESPWGKTQRDQKLGLEFEKKEYEEIDRYCRSAGIDWFASAWDVESQKFLRQFKLKYNKIASAMLTHKEMVNIVAEEGLPTFISVGMSTYADVDYAVEVFRKRNCPFILLHTVSTYPSPDEDLNLKQIFELRKKYHCPIGYSGHESTVSPSVMAAMMGAVVLERHITLDRAMYGSDQAASLEKVGLENLVNQVRKIPLVVGDGAKKVTKGEESVAKKLRYWHSSGN
jgi:N-acetylneuraminate synthase